jgi:hypothetical protein
VDLTSPGDCSILYWVTVVAEVPLHCKAGSKAGAFRLWGCPWEAVFLDYEGPMEPQSRLCSLPIVGSAVWTVSSCQSAQCRGSEDFSSWLLVIWTAGELTAHPNQEGSRSLHLSLPPPWLLSSGRAQLPILWGQLVVRLGYFLLL